MLKYFEILGGQNRIIATQAWVEENYPGDWVEIGTFEPQDAPPAVDEVRILLESLGQAVLPQLLTEDALSDEQIEGLKVLFKEWVAGEAVKIDDWRRYGDNLYKCLQAHTTQSDWTPDITPALWVVRSAPGVVPDWKQPTGAHDVYMLGDRMRYTDGLIYESLIDNNSWSPTDYPQGWKVIS